jgi:hypothetical protein
MLWCEQVAVREHRNEGRRVAYISFLKEECVVGGKILFCYKSCPFWRGFHSSWRCDALLRDQRIHLANGSLFIVGKKIGQKQVFHRISKALINPSGPGLQVCFPTKSDYSMVQLSTINTIVALQTIITIPPLILVIYTLITFEHLRSKSSELILMLLITNFFHFFTPFISIHPHQAFPVEVSCIVQGATDQFLVMASTMWTVRICCWLNYVREVHVVLVRSGGDRCLLGSHSCSTKVSSFICSDKFDCLGHIVDIYGSSIYFESIRSCRTVVLDRFGPTSPTWKAQYWYHLEAGVLWVRTRSGRNHHHGLLLSSDSNFAKVPCSRLFKRQNNQSDTAIEMVSTRVHSHVDTDPDREGGLAEHDPFTSQRQT